LAIAEICDTENAMLQRNFFRTPKADQPGSV
jgi:hypothetical protein